MSELTTLEAFKEYLGETSDDDDARNQQLLDAVEAAVQRTTGRKLVSAERTEYFDGHGRKVLYLRERPVTGISGVWVDAQGYYGYPANAFGGSNDAWTEGTDYVRQRADESEGNAAGLLAISGTGNGTGFWPKGEGNIKVTYTAGYSPVPLDLVTAIHQLATVLKEAAEEGRVGPVKSETLGHYSYTLLTSDDATGADLVTAKAVIAGYREPVL